MATCKNCFRKYDPVDFAFSGWSLLFNTSDFCSHVCSDAAKNSSNQQRERESTQRKAAEAAECRSVERHIAELDRDRQRLQLEILQRDANRIAEEESEARSLGISRKELLDRRKKEEATRKLALIISEQERLAALEGMTRDQWAEAMRIKAIKKGKEKKEAKEALQIVIVGGIFCLLALAILFLFSKSK